MDSFRKLIKSFQRINILFSISIIIAIIIFASLGIYEVKTSNHINRVMQSYLKKVDKKSEKYIDSDHNAVHNELISHFNNHIKNSQFLIMSILIVIFLLSLLPIFIYVYFRQLKKIKNHQLLDELLLILNLSN